MDKLLVVTVLSCVCVVMAEHYGFELPPDYQRTSLGDGIDVSTMKVLKATYDASADKNIVSSPLGLMTLLSLYNLGAGSGAKSEITSFLGGTDFQKTFDSYRELNARFSEMNPDYLTVANKISVSKQYTLNEMFAASARAYRSEFDSVDFTKPEEAAAAINKWAAEKTKGHITEPVSKDALTPDVVAALFNVIYFNGHWHVPFKAEETKDKDFHVSRDNVIKKPMMHLLQSLYYTESEQLGAKMLELPYKEKGFRMVVVLPNEVDGLPSVLEKAAEKGLLSDVFKLNPAGRDVDLDMPKFDIRTKIDFNDILPKVGVSKIFREDAPGIVKGVPVKLSKAFQEAFIKVNEEGATAGAFTGLIAVPASSNSRPPPPMKFTVDHPFLYAILYEDKILFAGTYSK
ncbi:unnamed protein product [Arctia plantaginis]|uniref:Serpin domain-containing protein n=1 Tax=Arctia plantaginis TaxID=874455 RepID=A0A8S0Z816_ARCPL|nr:unnamed protein product [Arctia plantaginis]